MRSDSCVAQLTAFLYEDFIAGIIVCLLTDALTESEAPFAFTAFLDVIPALSPISDERLI